MPSSVTLTSVEIEHFKRTRKQVTARFEFSLTKKLIAAMGWGELADFETASTLKGDLAASNIVLTPVDEALKRHQTEIAVSRVHAFNATRQEIEGSRGKGTRWLVQCDVVMTEPTACKKLEAYMLTAGKSEMRISYEKQAEQADLPGTEPTEDGDGKED